MGKPAHSCERVSMPGLFVDLLDGTHFLHVRAKMLQEVLDAVPECCG